MREEETLPSTAKSVFPSFFLALCFVKSPVRFLTVRTAIRGNVTCGTFHQLHSLLATLVASRDTLMLLVYLLAQIVAILARVAHWTVDPFFLLR